jgi:hypothetical protein
LTTGDFIEATPLLVGISLIQLENSCAIMGV